MIRAAAIFLFCLSACRDSEPPEPAAAALLNGAWNRADNPNWHYVFQDGDLQTWIFDLGGTVIEQRYAYTGKDDTLFLVNLNTGDRRTWTAQVIGDTAEITDFGNGVLGFYFELVRVK